jgi:uncharacterized membrane protein
MPFPGVGAGKLDGVTEGSALMPVRLFGHAVHPLLIVFPLGLLTASVGFDLLWYATGRDGFAMTAGTWRSPVS